MCVSYVIKKFFRKTQKKLANGSILKGMKNIGDNVPQKVFIEGEVPRHHS